MKFRVVRQFGMHINEQREDVYRVETAPMMTQRQAVALMKTLDQLPDDLRIIPWPPAPVTAWWLSWWHHGDRHGDFELHSPWWVSGHRFSDAHDSICAAVRAENADAAKALILAAYDTPPTDLEWRFAEALPHGQSPFSERFPRAGWMVWTDRP